MVLEDWLSKPAALTTEVDATAAVPVTPMGVFAGVATPDAAHTLAIHTQTLAAPVWWVGVHGGAGESTLATVVGGSAAGHAWPRHTDGSRSPVVLVARTHQAGLEALSWALRTAGAGLVPFTEVVGVVLVADAPGKLPRALRDLSAHVAAAAPRVWRMPWVNAWRMTGATTESCPPVVDVLRTDLQLEGMKK